MTYLTKILSFLYKNKLNIVKFFALALFMGLVSVAFLFIYYSKDLPSSDALSDLFVAESTKIYDRTGTTALYDIHGEEKRTIIAYEEMPEHIKHATIVAEDSDFYRHMGLDFKGMARASLKNIREGEIEEGGSTITQQFIKNAILTPERTFARKIKEAVLSLELEWKHSKDEILAFYLNQVPYGLNAYGVEAAAQTYFDKNAKDMTLAESATLAALPNAPTYYGNNPDALFTRQKNILNKMLELGYISEEEHREALEEDIEMETFVPDMQAPHFVTEVKTYLEDKYGVSFVQQSGLKVITTLDKSIQEAAEEAVSERIDTNASNYNAHNASLVALDPHSGHILAMVGSRGYFSDPYPEDCVPGQTCLFDPQVNITKRLRQPGSSFKPFAYATALEKGYTPDTILFDVPTEFNPSCSWQANSDTGDNGARCYNPQNYDNAYFGPITMKEALAQSRNIPAVKTLYLAGVNETMDLARDMGINSFSSDSSRYGLSLVLGGGEVTLLEETSAYGVFATRGEQNPPTFVLRIEDKEGNVLEEYQKDSKKVLDETIADQINHMLSTNEYRTRAFGSDSYLNIPGVDVAAKTGTTQSYRDAWTVGYTSSLTAGVWVGNNNNAEMYGGSGSSVAAPIWNSFMKNAYSKKVSEEELEDNEFYFSLPAMNQEKRFNEPSIEDTGKPVLDGEVTSYNSILRFVNLNDVQGDAPERPQNNPQYFNWDMAVRSWGHSLDLDEDEEEEENEEEDGDESEEEGGDEEEDDNGSDSENEGELSDIDILDTDSD